jgi:hypothetical protein
MKAQCYPFLAAATTACGPRVRRQRHRPTARQRWNGRAVHRHHPRRRCGLPSRQWGEPRQAPGRDHRVRGLFFDYDNDGWIDIFLVDGGSVADPAVARQARHRLFRNRGNGTFEDATERSGIRHRDYGMGACAGDYDNDGRIDLYVTNIGPNVLYRNAGNGEFTDVTRAARVGTPLWSTGCAFADLDRDGDLDLFVTNYVAADLTHNPFCGNAKLRLRFYCHPLNYEPLPNIVYRNDGNGTFTDVSESSGIGRLRGNGLGVVIADVDDDRWPDVFVANDSVPNFLFRNAGNWHFTRSDCAPAWQSRSTARHAPAWGWTPVITMRTDASTWWSPISIRR